ncbi:YgjP-like metallopeptidase domain-containing protein [Helicobacter sp. UBA3407]|uniref:M48 family metallopeptidase n=2 Tax=Helicobacter TaxID=209 RepID=UPI0026036173|nr:YgjP-like metallopeptidase domain-containing protein [Helicobacter sp. UBA3407]
MLKNFKLPTGFPPSLVLKVVQKRHFKHLKMRFCADSTLIVNLPRYVSKRACEEFIATNLQWILKHFDTIKQQEANISLNQFYLFGQWVEFETLLLDRELESYLQKRLQDFGFEGDCAILMQLWQAVMQENLLMNPIGAKSKLQSLLRMVYQKALESYISLHINAISQKMQLFPKSICYGKSYRQLGCCRAKDQSVRFSLRLALMPYFCIDSVIIHELAHLRYPHHGQDFWNLVRTFDDNPQGIQEWLQANYSLNARLYQKIFK